MKDIKIFGTYSCPGCMILKGLLDKKGVNYNFLDVTDSDGLAELASLGLADELAIPIVVIDGNKEELDSFSENIESLPDKEGQDK